MSQTKQNHLGSTENKFEYFDVFSISISNKHKSLFNIFYFV